MSTSTGRSSGPATPFTNPVLVGTTIVVALIVGLFLSYNANKGLPFVKTFPLKAQVPDAAELVAGSEVRIGGFRVGQVNKITAMPAVKDKPPFAELQMNLDGSIKSIPADTVVRVRPRSLLGAKYVELEPGTTSRDLPAGSTLPLRQARATPELDESFNVFDAQTRRGLQGTIRSLGDALAGRGADINRGFEATARLLPPLQRVTQALADPQTDLNGFVDGAARTSAALAPVATTLGDLFDHGAITLQALDAGGSALGRAIEALPRTEAQGLVALRDVSPVLHDLADLTVNLREGARRLPVTTRVLADALQSGTRVLRQVPGVAPLADTALETLGRVARDPAASGAVRKLTTTVKELKPTLDVLTPAQTVCNVGGLFARNLTSTISAGDQSGTWLTFIDVLRVDQISHAATPDRDLHFNPYPTENGTECEAGNEPYSPGQTIGSPAGLQPTTTAATAPPAGTGARAAAAGLLDHIPGASG